MNTTLSTQQVRLAAAVGLLAVAVLAWWVLVARQHSDSAAPAVAVPAHALPTHHAKPVQQSSAARHAKPSSHATKSHAAPVKIARHGLPLTVAEALTRHRVVVVSLSIPGVALDRLAANESEAAAKASNVGFVGLNVVEQREGGPLLAKLGVIDTPAVLVVRRRGSSVFAKFRGFVDRDTVEQAVADARR